MTGALSVDLVVPTVGRTIELRRFLESVAAQTWRGPLRVIVIDQNPDDRLLPILGSFADRLTLLHLHSEQGESPACNAGFRQCEADIIGRADDDCWYPPNLLEQIVEAFGDHPEWDALTGVTCDESGRLTQLRWDRAAGVVTRRNIFRRAIAPALFMRRSLVESVGPWDESFGTRPSSDGTIGGASAESDYLLRAIAAGFTIEYQPEIRVHHPDYRPSIHDRKSMRKAYSYGVDHSRLLKLHGFPLWYAGWRSAQLVGASGLFLAKGKPGTARFYAAMARGRLRGWFLPGKR